MTNDHRDDWHTPELLDLCGALVTLQDPEEAASFLRDLCTRKELADLTGRWAIVRQLEAGLPYREIAERCATSTATVTRVNQWLHHGTGGYRAVLDRLEA